MFHLSTFSVKWRIPKLTSKFDLLIIHKKIKITNFFAISNKQYADIELNKSNFYDSNFRLFASRPDSSTPIKRNFPARIGFTFVIHLAGNKLF